MDEERGDRIVKRFGDADGAAGRRDTHPASSSFIGPATNRYNSPNASSRSRRSWLRACSINRVNCSPREAPVAQDVIPNFDMGISEKSGIGWKYPVGRYQMGVRADDFRGDYRIILPLTVPSTHFCRVVEPSS
jgi:hypothetical protein